MPNCVMEKIYHEPPRTLPAQAFAQHFGPSEDSCLGGEKSYKVGYTTSHK